MNNEQKQRYTIADLERMINREEDHLIEILPNGEIKVVTDRPIDIGDKKPLTLRENLGGEYAA